MIVSGNLAPRHRSEVDREGNVAECTDYHGQAMGWGCIDPWCAFHEPEQYAVEVAKHRSDMPPWVD